MKFSPQFQLIFGIQNNLTWYFWVLWKLLNANMIWCEFIWKCAKKFKFCDRWKLVQIKMISTILEKFKTGYNPMMEGVRWAEQYATQIERLWKHIPNWLGQTLIFISIFLFASGIQGTMSNLIEENGKFQVRYLFYQWTKFS